MQKEFGTETCKLKLPFPFVLVPTLLLYIYRNVIFQHSFQPFSPFFARPTSKSEEYKVYIFYLSSILLNTNPLVILKE